MPLTYSNYLKLEQILSAQEPLSAKPEHDEMLFIIIHQVYELWFKQILHEVDYLSTLLIAGDTPRSLHTLRRILTILKTLVGQIDILETMTPLEFLSFRDRLESASGFQSFQFRALEFALGHKHESVMIHYPEGSTGRLQLNKRYQESTLWDSFLSYLKGQGYNIPDYLLKRDVTHPTKPSLALQQVLMEIYNNNPIVVRVCERLVDLDEGIQEWRYRHIKMVSRTIGNKTGSGGSTGIEYLQTTLSKPLFPDLWVIRTKL